MSLFSTLNTGAAGMTASSTNMSVIGDNIANLGTTGFNGSATRFVDTFPNTVAGLGGLQQIGTGVRVGEVATDFAQGTLNETTSAIDVAIVGNGFFQVRQNDEFYYTRDGSFHLDASNALVTSSGLRVQGYAAINGVIPPSVVGDIVVDPAGIPQQVTSTIQLDATLAADADIGLGTAADNLVDVLRTATPFDGTATAPTILDVTQAGDFSTSVTIFDSLGLKHDVTVVFERDATAPDTWNYYAMVDGSEVDTTGDGINDGVAGNAFEIGTGTVQFDANGDLTNHSGMIVTAPGWTFGGSAGFVTQGNGVPGGPYDLALNLGGDPNALGFTEGGSIRMTGSESYVTAVSQDGFGAGVLEALRVDQDGIIFGQYTNGQEQALGQVAVATFQAESGLERLGSNLFQDDNLSGQASLGVAGTGGRGTITGFALESSNVELEEQFVNMIRTQRMYQANTGVIRTADEALQTLIQLV